MLRTFFVLLCIIFLVKGDTPAPTPTSTADLSDDFSATNSASIGRITTTFIYAGVVFAVCVLLAAADRFYPTTTVRPRTFPVTELEKRALAPPQSRYCVVGRARGAKSSAPIVVSPPAVSKPVERVQLPTNVKSKPVLNDEDLL